jgi:hypothetical protein
MVLPEQQLQEAITVTGDGYHAERIRWFYLTGSSSIGWWMSAIFTVKYSVHSKPFDHNSPLDTSTASTTKFPIISFIFSW